MFEITSQPWFHGEIDRDTAEKRLRRNPGTFLVRYGTSDVPTYPFSLSRSVPGAAASIVHTRIRRNEDGALSVALLNPRLSVISATLIEAIEALRLQGVLGDSCPTKVTDDPYQDS
eukprot:m51a1_g12568 putative sh2 domain-containing protein (116) ;mRNA; f:1877-2290